MKIYTKTGDTGETGLFGGSRVPKDDLRIETYGTADELNAVLGTAGAQSRHEKVRQPIERIQAELFQFGAELATPPEKNLFCEKISTAEVQNLETEIDAMEAELPPLKNFILPGGTQAAATIHLARTICRRCERLLVRAMRDFDVRPDLERYINRLSDHLFVLARYENHLSQQEDTPWVPRNAKES